jgi:hypothetical protein
MEKIIVDGDLVYGCDLYESGSRAFSRWPDRIYHYSPAGKYIAKFKIKE